VRGGAGERKAPKTGRRSANCLLTLLAAFCVALALLFFSLEIGAYDKAYYMQKFEANGAAQATGWSRPKLSAAADALIGHLQTGDNELLEPFFNEREITHMEDVYGLFWLQRAIRAAVLAILCLILIRAWVKGEMRRLLRGVSRGLFGTYLFLAVVVVLFASGGFTAGFTAFHEIFFTNDLWLLDPRTDYMIRLLPENFFMDMGIRIGLWFCALNAAVQLLCWLLARRMPDADR
jgi:integral membrane protein (TIGR01906 family)